MYKITITSLPSDVSRGPGFSALGIFLKICTVCELLGESVNFLCKLNFCWPIPVYERWLICRENYATIIYKLVFALVPEKATKTFPLTFPRCISFIV